MRWISGGLRESSKMIEEIRNIDSSKKELKKFGLSVGGVSALIGAALFFFGRGSSVYFLAIGILLIAAGFFTPKLLKPLQKPWMALAILLGMFSTRLILSLLFYLVITPMALIAQIAGKKFLDEKFNPDAKSYWHYRKREEYKKEFTERQF